MYLRTVLFGIFLFFIQLTMTASTLYEAVEPQILWKQLLTGVVGEVRGNGAQVDVGRPLITVD